MDALPWRSVTFYLYLVYVTYVIAITVKIVLDNRHPQVTMAWLLAIFFLPYVGVILYSFAGVDWKKKKIVKNRPEEYFGEQLKSILARQKRYLQGQVSNTDNDEMKLLTLLLNSSNSVITLHNRIRTFFRGARLFSRMLLICDESLEIVTALSGEQALRELEREPPDLMLLDIIMPDIDGWDVLEAMRQRGHDHSVPTFLVSAQDPADQPPMSRFLVTTLGEGLPLGKLLRCSLELSSLLLRPGPEPDPGPP